MSLPRRALGLANRVLRPLGTELAPSAELEQLRMRPPLSDAPIPTPPPLPAEAPDHLAPGNPRLAELMERYAAMPEAVTR